jgi:hypothetical protein
MLFRVIKANSACKSLQVSLPGNCNIKITASAMSAVRGAFFRSAYPRMNSEQFAGVSQFRRKVHTRGGGDDLAIGGNRSVTVKICPQHQAK